MKGFYRKEIEQISKTGYLNSKLSFTDALIENFYDKIMTPEEKTLMTLVFSKNPTQEDLDNLLKLWDIEVKGGNKSLLLSYFMKRHPELSFTSYEGPRLKGLLQNFRFRNMQVISHFVKLGKVLNKNGITPVILKGGAMKYLRPELPRIMGDIDILVPEKDYKKSIELALSLGFYYEKMEEFSVDMHDPKTHANALDIHKFIDIGSRKDKKLIGGIFKRAQKRNVFGIETLVPAYEDMMFIALVNLSRNLRNSTSMAGLLYTLFDCKFFLENKPDFDWNIVKENARKTETEIFMNFALKFINKISQDVFPAEFKTNLPFEKETNAYSTVVLYDRFYLEDLRCKCRAIKIEQLIKDPSLIVNYIHYKPKYFFLKLLRNHPNLIGFFIRDLKTKEYKFEEC